MTRFIKKMTTRSKTSPFFSASKVEMKDSLQQIDKVNGMDMFKYPSSLFSLS